MHTVILAAREAREPGPTPTTGSLMTLYVYILAKAAKDTLYRRNERSHPSHRGAAIEREKTLKRWRRDWKRPLIEENNPHWADLFGTIAPGFAVGPGSDANASVRDDMR